MSDPAITLRSALPGACFQGRTSVAEMGLRGMLTLRGDLASPAVAQAVKAAVGLDIPPQRRIILKGDSAVGWMSPDELLLMMPHDMAQAAAGAARKALAQSHALVADVSDARCVFRLVGAEAPEVLARLAPVDMSGLAADELRRTRLAQVPAAFWRSGADSFDLVAFRSVAAYVFDLLQSAAASSTVGYLTER